MTSGAPALKPRIEKLARAHVVEAFDCGAEPLNTYLKRFALERPFDRTQAVGPLGMALAHVVREAGGMRDDERRSAFHVLASDFRSPEIEPLVSRSRRRKSICDNVREWLMGQT